MMKETVDYAYLQEHATTFDILLWSGGSKISSIIRTFTKTKWCSHVGMIVRMKDDPEVYTFESDWDSKTTDILTGTKKNGPRLVNLREKMKHYDGRFCAYRALHLPPEMQNDPELYSKLWEFMEHTRSKHYEYNLLELFLSTFRANIANTHAYFCTELVAQCWMDLGILSPTEFSNNVKLNDYLEEQQPSSILKFAHPGIHLDHEFYIDLSPYKQ